MEVVPHPQAVDEGSTAGLADHGVARAADVPGLRTSEHLTGEVRDDGEAPHRLEGDGRDVRAAERLGALAHGQARLPGGGGAAVIVISELDGEMLVQATTCYQG